MISVTSTQTVELDVAVEVQCASCGLGLNADFIERYRAPHYLKTSTIKVEPCVKCTGDQGNPGEGLKTMSNEGTTAVVPQDTRAIALGAGQVVAIIPQTFDEVYRMATIIARSGIGPKGMNEAQCAVAIMAGAEVGVPPMAAVQNIAVINGRPSMWGDLIVALVQASGKLEYLLETWDEKTQTATVRIKRIGKPEHVETFGPTEAKRAKLADKETYKMYPQRMHGWKAKNYAIKSEFADVLKGLSIREEVEDYVDVESVPVHRTLPPMPGAIVAGTAPTNEPPVRSVQDDAPADTERTIEDEISELGECLNKPAADIAQGIKLHAKAGKLEQLRDQLRGEYRGQQGGE